MRPIAPPALSYLQLPNSFMFRRSEFVRFFHILTRSLLGSALMLASAGQTADKKVSYYHEVVPILKRSCTGCHHPGKLKGELDLTTYAAFQKVGKHGAGFKAGDPKESTIIEEVSGKE